MKKSLFTMSIALRANNNLSAGYKSWLNGASVLPFPISFSVGHTGPSFMRGKGVNAIQLHTAATFKAIHLSAITGANAAGFTSQCCCNFPECV